MNGNKRQIGENIGWGIRFGLILSAVLIAFVSVGYIVRPQSPSHRMLGWLQLCAAYLASGLVCGLVVGVCRPLITSLTRSILLGPVVAFPFYVIIGSAASSPFWTWDAVYWTLAAIAAVIVGTIVGGFYWGMFSQSQQ
jgi:hypothetical protein